MVITSSYTASFTSILTVQRLSSPITGIDSLIASNLPIGYQGGTFTYSYLTESLFVPKSSLVRLGSPEEYERALRLGPHNGGVAAIIDELPYVELFLSNQTDFGIIGQPFTKSGWGFVSSFTSQVFCKICTKWYWSVNNLLIDLVHSVGPGFPKRISIRGWHVHGNSETLRKWTASGDPWEMVLWEWLSWRKRTETRSKSTALHQFLGLIHIMWSFQPHCLAGVSAADNSPICAVQTTAGDTFLCILSIIENQFFSSHA